MCLILNMSGRINWQNHESDVAVRSACTVATLELLTNKCNDTHMKAYLLAIAVYMYNYMRDSDKTQVCIEAGCTVASL